ncbi:MAG: FecR domain-containing protein [Cyclobacteriaceae bacterium]
MNYENYSVEELAIDDSFVNWCTGENIEDVRKWEQWLAIHPDQSEKVLQAKQLVTCLSLRLSNEDFLIEKERLAKAIPEEVHYVRPISRANVFWRNVGKIAAILVVGFFIGFAIKQYNQPVQVQEESQPKVVVKENPSGQKSTIFLADGSKVYLNADSRLSYSEDFGIADRNIELEGEAYFEVARNEQLPFNVTSRNVSTIALGTAFNINAYDQEPITVSLTSGKVKVLSSLENGSSELYLIPGEEVRYSQGVPIQKRQFDIEQTIAWKSGVLQFSEAKFSEITKRLERWYGVRISVVGADDIKDHYTGSFNNKSLEFVLDVMGYTKGFTHSIDDKNVKIEFE